MKKTPAFVVIKAFGGRTATAKVVGRSRAAVGFWLKTGLIPSKLQRKILKKAKRLEIRLTEKDIIWGRK